MAPAVPSGPFAAGGAETSAPLSDAQTGIWLLTQLAPESAFYNESFAVRLPAAALDVAALERSLAEIVTRHSVWRTTFEVIDGEPRQVVHPAAPFDLTVLDLRSHPEAQRAHEAQQIASAHAQRRFDLATGPLVRGVLVSLSDREHTLFVTVHHVVVDGVTFYTVFVPELARLYTAYTRGTTPELPPLVVQYGDYARWRQQPSPQDRLAYWAERLSGDLPSLDLAADRPRPARPTHGGGRVQSTLSADFRNRVAATAAAAGTTPFVVLLTVFLAQLHKLRTATRVPRPAPWCCSTETTG
jgi:hypothetical protein